MSGGVTSANATPPHLEVLPQDREQDRVLRASPRYARKKDAIVSAATGILNRRGVKGMTLADVAAAVDLSTTSVTYYFKKKEDLAVACFLRGIEWFDRLAAGAFISSDRKARLRRFLELYLESNRRIREGEEPLIAMFNDIRALKEPHLSIVSEPYPALFRRIRTLFQGPGLVLPRNAAAKSLAIAESVLGVLVVFVEAVRSRTALTLVLLSIVAATLLAFFGEVGFGLVALGFGAAVIADHAFDWLTTR